MNCRIAWLGLLFVLACSDGAGSGPQDAATSGTGGNGASGGGGNVFGTSGTSGTSGASGAPAAARTDGGHLAADGGSADGSAGGVGKDGCQKRPLFPAGMPWNQSVASAPADAASDTIIAALQSRGWGAGRMQIDFSIDVLCADESAPFRTFEKTDNFFDDECDDAPVPIPAGGHVEGFPDYHCAEQGDCHLIVIHGPTATLYEQWVASIDPQDHYSGGCLAVWDLTRTYPETLRGDQCSSADAAGLPIAPLLFDADEVAAGVIEHAVRFALPNAHLSHRTFVRPATHATGAASAGDDGVPYGARLRLRADFPLDSLPNNGARVVARALQDYGMILADGGNIALMGQTDVGTEHKWDGLLGPHDLTLLQPSDFELVEAGARHTWDGSCTLSP